jgi:DNA-binding transcriptional regulator YdaS (Cro superfamily)
VCPPIFLVARTQDSLYKGDMKPFMHRPALVEAINIAGSQAKLAKAIGKQQGHVWFWLKEAKKISPSIAIKIEQATDGKVSRARLCPELSPEYRP